VNRTSSTMVYKKRRKVEPEPEPEEVSEEEEEQEDEDEANGEEASAADGDAPKKRKRRSSKKPKDPNAPKKSLSSFVLFSSSMRPKVVQKNPSLKFTEIGAELGKLWKQLPEPARKPYNTKAEKDKARYNLEMESYTPSAEHLADVLAFEAQNTRRLKKDPSKPKRSRSAYLIFCDRHRAALQKKHSKKTMIELASVLSDSWKKISDKERAACDKIAIEEKAEYEKKLAAYTPSEAYVAAQEAMDKVKADAKNKEAGAKAKAKEKLTKAKSKVKELTDEIAQIEKKVAAAEKLKTKVAALQEDLEKTESKLADLTSK